MPPTMTRFKSPISPIVVVVAPPPHIPFNVPVLLRFLLLSSMFDSVTIRIVLQCHDPDAAHRSLILVCWP